MSDEKKVENAEQSNALPAHVIEAKKQAIEFMNPERWSIMKTMAETFIQSGALPAAIKNAPQLIMAMQAGYEAGMQPIEAISSFAPINGRMTMYGDALISQVKKAGHKVQWGECTGEKATVTITRVDTGESMTETYSLDEADIAGLLGKDNWRKYPKRMLKYKAFAEVAHFLVPDALRGIKITEEVEAEMDEVMKSEAVGTKKPTKKKKVEEVEVKEEHKPLGEVLEGEVIEEEKEEPASKKKPLSEKKLAEMTEEDKKAYYSELVEKELSGKQLTAKERMFCTSMQDKK